MDRSMIRALSICFFLLFTIVLGCTKAGKNISITGIVRNPVTGQPYADVQIKLLRTDGGLPGGLKDVETVYTNADGYFEIHHYGAYKHYELGAYPDTETKFIIGWFEDGVHVGNGRMNVEKGHYMNPVFEMVPYGLLNGHIENVNCQGPEDSMQFHSKKQFDDDYDGWSTIRVGCYFYSSSTPVKVPAGYRYYETKVTRNGFTSYVYDTVFISENSTSQFEILY